MVISNNKVACLPFETTNVKAKIERAFAQIEQFVQLQKTRVVFADKFSEFPVGTTIWVKGSHVKSLSAETFCAENDGLRFVLVPFEQIVAFDRSTKD